MRKGTILLIDDSASELLLCKTALENTEIDYPVVTFRDAESAYEYISRNGQDIFVIVCDIKMPPLSGLELLEKINADYHLKIKSIPFIFLSNSNSAKDIEQAYSLGAQGYYVKPLLLDELSDIFKGIVNYWKMAQIPNIG